MAYIVGLTRIYLVYLRVLKGECYVGKTSGFGDLTDLMRLRAGDCFKNYRTSSGRTKFWKAIEKYGWRHIESYPLAVCENEEDARNLETFFIHQYNSFEEGYNENTGEGDRDAGEILYYKINTLFDESDCCHSVKRNGYLKRNPHEHTAVFVKSIVEKKVSGKRRIKIEAKKCGVVVSTLQHYLYKSSDPSGNRYNPEFYKLWIGEDNVEEASNGTLFE